MHDTCGPRSATAFAFYDRATSSVRMSQGTLALDSTGSSVTLPASGIACGGRLYELPTSVPPTVASDCSSLLPTPRGRDKGTVGDYSSEGYRPTLTQALGIATPPLLPTPTVDDSSNLTRTSGDYQSLTRTAVSLLPTPAVNDMGEGKTPEAWDAWTAKMQAKHGNGNGHGKSLAIEAARLLPTPAARDHKGSVDPATRDRTMGSLDEAVERLLPTPGATTPPPSTAGNASSDAPLPFPPTNGDDSAPPSSSG